MERRLGQGTRFGLVLILVTILALFAAHGARSAPFAAMVMDARTGEVLYARNADTRLHPASLTKMMTLYITFQAIENGEISPDAMVQISRKAASEPPSKLGLRAGQKIKLRYLIRAAAVKSANDAATAIGEAIAGSEAAFARRMNRTAKALGMTRTTFRNANGLTEAGHLSTARDMTILGRHLLFDFPDYYNLFSRRSTYAGLRTVANTNRRFLNSYRGADGIKTGYTAASGFNLVASAKRGNVRLITTVFGGVSSAARNAKVAELMDLGFRRAPANVKVRPPAPPLFADAQGVSPGRSFNPVRAVSASIRPRARPQTKPPAEILMAMESGIEAAIAEAQTAPAGNEGSAAGSAAKTMLASATPGDVGQDGGAPVVVTRISTSGGRGWGINVGRFSTRYEAEKVLLKTALLELATLDDALRKVVRSPRGYEANFVGMSREMSQIACERLEARSVPCTPIGPG